MAGVREEEESFEAAADLYERAAASYSAAGEAGQRQPLVQAVVVAHADGPDGASRGEGRQWVLADEEASQRAKAIRSMLDCGDGGK